MHLNILSAKCKKRLPCLVVNTGHVLWPSRITERLVACHKFISVLEPGLDIFAIFDYDFVEPGDEFCTQEFLFKF